MSRIAFRSREYEQGVRRFAQRVADGRTRDALGICGSEGLERHYRRVPHRQDASFAVWRIEDRWRCDGTRIRPILQYAGRYIPRRLFDRTVALWRRASRFSLISREADS